MIVVVVCCCECAVIIVIVLSSGDDWSDGQDAKHKLKTVPVGWALNTNN